MLRDRLLCYKYDAFVSFDHDDTWVRTELMPRLESAVEPQHSIGDFSSEDTSILHRALSLCIHQRDFEAGSGIQENIVAAIEQSSKVILVLSNNFLRSHWCMFEFEMAQMQSLERGRNIIVPIMLTFIEMADMPSCLQWLVRRNTYISWNEDECPADREEFWTRLRRVLNDSGLDPWICECGKTIFEKNDARATTDA